MGKIINGKQMADNIINQLKPVCERLNHAHEDNPKTNYKPTLLIITSGNDDASKVYVRSKEKRCEELGIKCKRLHFDAITTDACHDIAYELIKNNMCPFIIQLPMNSRMTKECIMHYIDEVLNRKGYFMQRGMDADGFMNSKNIVFNYSPNYYYEQNCASDYTPEKFCMPCTPMGILYMLDHYFNQDSPNNKNALSGKHVVILGRSDLVGKPLSALLLERDCMVTMLHSKSTIDDYKYYIKYADIIISAMGNTTVLTKTLLDDIPLSSKVLIDVGMNRDENGKLRGDCDPEILDKFEAYTPVPGGVGPMTVAWLMVNTVKYYTVPGYFDIHLDQYS